MERKKNTTGYRSAPEACSIVASYFRDPAQRQLFKVVFIEFDVSCRSYNRNLKEGMASGPRLCSVIESLFLTIPPPRSQIDISMETSLEQLELPRVQYLTISSRNLPRRPTEIARWTTHEITQIMDVPSQSILFASGHAWRLLMCLRPRLSKMPIVPHW